MAKSITENFWFYVTDRLFLLLCKMEILSTLFVQNRCMQESGKSSDTENSYNLVLKGKGLWKFLVYNPKKKKQTKKKNLSICLVLYCLFIVTAVCFLMHIESTSVKMTQAWVIEGACTSLFYLSVGRTSGLEWSFLI